MRSSRTKGSKIPLDNARVEDPKLPFSVTISKDEMPNNYSGIPFDPQIFYGAQANGFYGNIRFKILGTTRVFFFQIQPGEQNMSNYYTIAVIVPGKPPSDPKEKNQLNILMDLCNKFESRNSGLIGEYTAEGTKLVNLAIQYLARQQGSSAWGSEIPPSTQVKMAIVFNQLDMGQLGDYYDSSEFPIALIDFNPPSGGKRKKYNKKRKTFKRKYNKRRKTIKRK
jgi:hypothetical protein